MLAFCLCPAAATASVFTGIEYGRDDDRVLVLDVRTPSKPGPFPVWVEWVERDASPLIVPDREIHAGDTVLVRAVMPVRVAARRAAAAQLLRWVASSVSGYGGDPERAVVIVRGAGAQALLDVWKADVSSASTSEDLPHDVRALILVGPPAALKGHRDWPDLPLLLIDAPARAASLWRLAFALRNEGIAAEPVVLDDVDSASPGLSAQVAAMLAARDVPRVQRFDQLAIDAPVVLKGRLLAALRHGNALVAMLWDGRGPVARLVSFDAMGAAEEARRWPWRDDARVTTIDGRLVAFGTDAAGRPHAEWSTQAGAAWHALPIAPVAAPVRLVAMAQQGRGDVALAWSLDATRAAARSWLQRIGFTSDAHSVAPGVLGTRVVEGAVRALAFADDDVFVALAEPAVVAHQTKAATLLRWRSANHAPSPVADAGESSWQALFALSPDGAVGAARAGLLGLRGGRLYAIDPACMPICLREELDYGSLVAAPPLAAAATAVGPSAIVRSVQGAPTAQWLQHPETGESLLALMPAPADTRGSERAGSPWLIRQANGRYGIARLPESRADGAHAVPRAVQPWPTVAEPNRFALIGGTRDRTLLFPAHLQRTGVTPGLWWDPTRSGHGFELRRAGDRWQVTIYTFDEQGAPLWLRGDGEVRDGRWRAGIEGLLRYRIPQGAERVEIDRRSVQSLEVDFSAARDDDSCTAADRTDGQAIGRATLMQGDASSVFCIEPLRLAGAGRPQVDVDGIWSPRDEPAPWQLALTTQGDDPRARISAMLTYFDRNGAPRWAYAASDWRDGAVDLSLLAVKGACRQCAGQPFKSTAIGQLSLRGRGECGAVRLSASLRIVRAGGAIGVPAGSVELAPSALLGCY